MESLEQFYVHVDEIRIGDLSLGVATTVILILLGVSIVFQYNFADDFQIVEFTREFFLYF